MPVQALAVDTYGTLFDIHSQPCPIARPAHLSNRGLQVS